ncbi:MULTISPECIES: hypothetical protein [unclassified Haloferax]|uniref:hypothetical protein n=1 Tax=unclassified Haloferax TaxID=2625095 RepID=UPI0002B10C95|nr:MULTISPECIES: hypothetical protein [unclassified Haloferax]ELZ60137.1 hypothetical protein C460_04470 [Haloferax sp. ATCC BAA-646]ELZ64349.1 hypothetical protein C459_07460 [Haloferax sp. ATCC BAA-645]ELZ69815.1 hypothetical protein C458_06034 [Haloferax sp. ATCC BAA-644]
MNAAWRRKVRREWGALTGGPLSATWWVTKAGLRVAFAEAMFVFLVLLNNDPSAVSAVADGEASVFSLVAVVLGSPGYLAIAGIVFAVALLLPFLPRRNEATNRWE